MATPDEIYHAVLRVEALLRELLAALGGAAPTEPAPPAEITCEVCSMLGRVVKNCPRCRGAGA